MAGQRFMLLRVQSLHVKAANLVQVASRAVCTMKLLLLPTGKTVRLFSGPGPPK